MRVIAGRYKGQLLQPPRGVNIRPTAQKVKQALFNILGKGIQNSRFLELFAGSGNVGIEAKSRRAQVVIFVENNRHCLRAIAQNLQRLGIAFKYGLKADVGRRQQPTTLLLPMEAQKALKLLGKKKQKFDFVFLDPPYAGDRLKNCLLKICRYDILDPHAWVIAEYRKSEVLPQKLGRLELMLSKRYGDTILSFFRLRC